MVVYCLSEIEFLEEKLIMELLSKGEKNQSEIARVLQLAVLHMTTIRGIGHEYVIRS
jgi:DNA-directed RNA polymerase specialized sigma subunit